MGDLDVSEIVLGKCFFYRKKLLCPAFVSADTCVNQFPDDIEDDDVMEELAKVSCQRVIPERSYAGQPIDQRTATVNDLCQCFIGNAGDSSCGCL